MNRTYPKDTILVEGGETISLAHFTKEVLLVWAADRWRPSDKYHTIYINHFRVCQNSRAIEYVGCPLSDTIASLAARGLRWPNPLTHNLDLRAIVAKEIAARQPECHPSDAALRLLLLALTPPRPRVTIRVVEGHP